jgi:nitrogen regulatory protein PII 2
MKEVMAVIRMNMINKTKRALSDAGITSFTARECLGRGKGLVDFKVLRGAELGYEEAIAKLEQPQRLIPKRWLTIIVPDKLVKKTLDVLIKTNQTGKSGDGKIFVLPIQDAYRIRTGDHGDKVLDEV